MKITAEFLHEKHACEPSYKWICENNLIETRSYRIFRQAY